MQLSVLLVSMYAPHEDARVDLCGARTHRRATAAWSYGGDVVSGFGLGGHAFDVGVGDRLTPPPAVRLFRG